MLLGAGFIFFCAAHSWDMILPQNGWSTWAIIGRSKEFPKASRLEPGMFPQNEKWCSIKDQAKHLWICRGFGDLACGTNRMGLDHLEKPVVSIGVQYSLSMMEHSTMIYHDDKIEACNFVNPIRLVHTAKDWCGGFHKWEYPKLAGWFISWKIQT